MEELIINIEELENISIQDTREVILKYLPTDDLTIELTEQDNLITTQETTLENVKQALQGKVGGGYISPIVEENTLIFSTGKVDGGVLSI